MRGPVTAGGRDLRTLAGIVSDDRGEPPAEGLAPSLLGDLLGLIRCDLVVFCGTDSSRQVDWFGQTVPTEADDSPWCCDLHLFSAVSTCSSRHRRAWQARREIARLRSWQSVKTDA